MWGMPEALGSAHLVGGRCGPLASTHATRGVLQSGLGEGLPRLPEKGGEIVEGEGMSRVRLEDFDERQSRLNTVSETESMNSTDMDELYDLELITETYGDVFEGFDDFDRAIETVEDFIRLVNDPRVNGYVKRAEAEKVLSDLDEFRRRYLDVVGKPAEMLYRELRSLILRVCKDAGR